MTPFKHAFLIQLILISGLFSCSNAQTGNFQLKGNLEKHPNAWLYLEHIQKNNTVEKIDSVKTDAKGNFVFKKKVSVKDFYRLRTGENNQVFIVLEPSESVEYTNNGQSLIEQYQLKGSKEGDVVLEIKAIKKRSSAFIDSLNQVLGAMQQSEQQAVLPQMQATYEQFLQNQTRKLIQIVDANSDKIAILIAAEQIEPEHDFASYEKIASNLEKHYGYSTVASQVINRANQLKKTAEGQIAPEIDLPDPSGKNIALSSLKGKVVLIDFWASWCGPCRRENPNVVKMYQRFKDKGFEIYSVSLDRDKNSWMEAIKKDGLIWPSHVSDLAYWNSSVVPQYGFTGIPFTVLIDREGKIIAKGLRGQQLENKLASLLEP